MVLKTFKHSIIGHILNNMKNRSVVKLYYTIKLKFSNTSSFLI